MRSLFVLALSVRAVGKLIVLALLCLAILFVVGIVVGPGVAVLAGLALLLLARAVIRAVRS